jgi:hypothetical protein
MFMDISDKENIGSQYDSSPRSSNSDDENHSRLPFADITHLFVGSTRRTVNRRHSTVRTSKMNGPAARFFRWTLNWTHFPIDIFYLSFVFKLFFILGKLLFSNHNLMPYDIIGWVENLEFGRNKSFSMSIMLIQKMCI